MTDNILKKIKSIRNIEFPKGLHDKIIKELILSKFEFFFAAVLVLLPINLIILGSQIWRSTIEAEASSLINAMLEGFEPSFDFLSSFAQTMAEVLPVNLIIVFILNLIITIYIIIHLRSLLNKLSFNKIFKGR